MRRARARSVARALAFLVIGVLTATLLAACGSSDSNGPAAPGHSVGTKLSDPQPVPDAISAIQFTNYKGKTVTLGSLKGKTVVISDVLTLCQETCPMETADLVAAARRVDAAGLTGQVEFLTVTVDPHRDTPRRLAAYRKFFARPGELPNWDLLTGKPSDLKALWKYFGVFVKRTKEESPPAIDWLTHKPLTYDVAHGDQVIFLDGHTRERFVITGPADVPNPSSVPKALTKFLSAQGHKNLRHPGPLAWKPAQVEKVVAWLTDTPMRQLSS